MLTKKPKKRYGKNGIKKEKQLFFDFVSTSDKKKWIRKIESAERIRMKTNLFENIAQIEEEYPMLLVGFEKQDIDRVKGILNNPAASTEDLRSAKNILSALKFDLEEKAEGKKKSYWDKLRDGDF